MGIPIDPGHRHLRAAFTLVELLLTIALILLLAAAAVFNFDALQNGSRLDEGVTQLESLFRFARAQAACTGRQVRVDFDDSTSVLGSTNAVSVAPQSGGDTNSGSGLRVVWEPDPLGAPGVFAELPESLSLVRQTADLISVREVRPAGFNFTNSFAANPMDAAGLTATNTTFGSENASGNSPAQGIPPVHFYPDGSSDSVQVVVQSRDDLDHRQYVVTLSGYTGAMRHRLLVRSLDGSPVVDDDRSAVSPAATNLYRP
jgi:prepilin-type N-terminal cleavage/methylation domain-containing protein